MRRKTLEKLFSTILQEVGNPDIRLVSLSEWGTEYTIAGTSKYNKVTVLYINRTTPDIKYNLWREILHVISQNRPSWWLDIAAGTLSKTVKPTTHSLKTFGDRDFLLHLCRIASLKLNNKQLKLEA